MSGEARGQRVAVVGGGVIGLTIAHRLAAAGASVTVIDRTASAQEASWAAGGILGPQLEAERPGPFLELALRSRTLYPALAATLKEQTGLSIGYRETGMLRLAFTEDQAQSLAATHAWQRASQLRAELLSPVELRGLEPSASPHAIAGLWLPDDHQVEPRRLLAALRAGCVRLGVSVLLGEALELETRGDRVSGVRTSAGRLEADRVVLAAGVWSGALAPLGIRLPLEPVRGQIVELRVAPGMLQRQLNGEGVYLVPREDGRVLVGSTMERVGFDRSVTDAAVEGLLRGACKLCPSLSGAAVNDRWAGLRPATPDHLPILSAGPLTGLFFATGHFRNGVLLAPITARIVLDWVSEGPRVMDLNAFRHTRFFNEPN